ncbi:hypothetical protein [Luteitalea pratensis]|nr:hypothetical protein [Luteitalea pratensis]
MRNPLMSAGVTTVGMLLTATLMATHANQQPAPRPATTAASQPTPAATAASTDIRVDRLVDRVWVAESSTTVPAGAMYVFLSDNVLVMSATGKPPSLGSWAEDVAGLVITEKGTTAKVDVLELTAQRLRIRIHGKTTAEITFAPAIRPPEPPPAAAVSGTPGPGTAAAGPAAPIVPIGMAFRCGADALRVAFENDKAYITWPDGTTATLSETRSPETSASRRMYSDGQLRVVEDTSESFTRVLFARPGFRPRACTPAR